MARTRFIKWLRDTRGVAAIEFALATPIFLGLLLGSIDILNLMLIHQKIEKVAYTMADLVSQMDQVTQADINDFMLAPSRIMSPFGFDTQGVVIISSIHRAAGSADALVRWRETGGGTLSRSSEVGAVGGTATPPGGLTLNERDNIIVAEVYYAYEHLLPVDFLTDGDVYKTATFKPRFGALLTEPN